MDITTNTATHYCNHAATTASEVAFAQLGDLSLWDAEMSSYVDCKPYQRVCQGNCSCGSTLNMIVDLRGPLAMSLTPVVEEDAPSLEPDYMADALLAVA